MWVYRQTIHAAPGSRNEAVALINEAPRLDIAGYSRRVLLPRTGENAFAKLIIEAEFESLDAFWEAWEESWASPEGVAWMTKWREVSTGQSSFEISQVAE